MRSQKFSLRVAAAFLIPASFLAVVFSAHSQSFEYLSGMSVELGKAWNPMSPSDTVGLAGCFDVTVNGVSPTATDNFEEKFVQTYSEFQKNIGAAATTNVSVDLGIASASGQTSADYVREKISRGTTLVYLVSGRRVYSPKPIDRVALTAAGRSFQSNREEFERQCGGAIVSSVTKETVLSVAYIFTTKNSSFKESIQTAISGAASAADVVGVGGSLSLLDAVRKVDSEAQMEVRVFQSGSVDSIDSLRSVIGRSDIKEVKKELRSAIASIRWESSSISKFVAADVSRYFAMNPFENWGSTSLVYDEWARARKHSEIIVERIKRLEYLKDRVRNHEFSFKQGKEREINEEILALKRQLSLLKASMRNCFDSRGVTCDLTYAEVRSNVIDFLDISFGEFSTWRVDGHFHWEGQATHSDIVGEAEYWPVFDLKNVSLIDHVDLLKNKSLVRRFNRTELMAKIGETGLFELPIAFGNHRAFREYCFSGNPNACNAKTNDKKHWYNAMKGDDDSFELVLIDVDGGRHVINAGLQSKTTY